MAARGTFTVAGSWIVPDLVQPGNLADVLTSAGPDAPPAYVPPAVVINPGFPVESVLFFSLVNTDPNELLMGIGTWELLKNAKLLFSDGAMEVYVWKRIA